MEMVFGMVFGILIFMIGMVFPIFIKRLELDLENKSYAREDYVEESPEEVATPSHYDEFRREMETRTTSVPANPPQFTGNVPQTVFTGLYDDESSVEIVTELQELDIERQAYR